MTTSTSHPIELDAPALPRTQPSRWRRIAWRVVPPLVFFGLFIGFLYLVSYV